MLDAFSCRLEQAHPRRVVAIDDRERASRSNSFSSLLIERTDLTACSDANGFSGDRSVAPVDIRVVYKINPDFG